MAIFILVSAPPALADFWYEYYERALEAVKKQDWRTVAAETQQAIQNKPDSSSNARTYGMNFTPYFPHFQLGRAYYHLGQPELALQAFDTEEQIGEIAGTQTEAQLRDYRTRIQQDISTAQAAAESRKQTIIDEALANAKQFEDQGQLDNAIRALTNAAAVDPNHADVTATLGRLQQKLRDQQVETARTERIARLVADGRTRLAANDFQQAASLFSQAFDESPDPTVKALLEGAQASLREEISSRENEQNRQSAIRDGLAQARREEAAGNYAEALNELQPVLARDPGNAEATTLQTRLLRARSQRDQDQQHQTSIGELLAEAQIRLEAVDYDGVMLLSQRVLALDTTNRSALGFISKVYAARGPQLLGLGNTAPFVTFFNKQVDRGDGTLVELLASPRFMLTGVVAGSSAVRVNFKFSEDGDDELAVSDDSTGIDLGWSVVPFGTNMALFTFGPMNLSPGDHLVSIIATDAEGLRQREDFFVHYDPPFYRSPWSWAAALGLLTLGIIGFFAARVRKRNRLLSRRFNPFIAGAPVIQDNLFFGRDRLLARVMQSIHNNSILLYGERRIGKTSFQHQLKRRLHIVRDGKVQFFPVYIDLQGTPEAKFFPHIAEEIFEELRPQLGGVEPSPKLLQDGGYDYRDFVGDIKNVINALKAKSDRTVKLVLLMDEVDTLNDYDPRVNQRLRSLFMRNFSENLACVMSGVAIKKKWESEGSPWYNFFEEIPIESFRREDAVQLIEEPIKGVFVLEAGVVDRIIELTDCKPYLIQKLCIRLVYRLHDERRRKANVEDVDALGRPMEGS